MTITNALRTATVTALLMMVGGCGASIPGLSTSALTPAKPAAPQNDPMSRALQVGSTAARALKCGFNFDPVKLRTQFLAAEAVAAPTEADKTGKIYDTAFNGISKAVAGQSEAYCTEQKTADIKEALNRHLAGDYTPTPPKPQEPEDEGLFSGVPTDSNGDSEYGKKMQKSPREW